MKKKLCIMLALVLLFSSSFFLLQGSAQSVTFVAVNDDLMEMGVYTPIYSGVTYIPGNVFNEGLGIVYSYNSSTNMAILYTSERTLMFDMVNDNSFDDNGNIYSSYALRRDSRAYLPLDFVCSMFALTYTWNTTELGSLLRIKNSSAVLNDSAFISAASSLMKSRYNAYIGSESTPSSSPSSTGSYNTPIVTTRPSSTPTQVTARLCFFGALDEHTAAILDTLGQSGVSAAFFTDAESLASRPDLARRIFGEGHTLGADVDSIEEAERFNTMLDAVLLTKTRFIGSSTDPEEMAAAGYIPCSCNVSFDEGLSQPVGTLVGQIESLGREAPVNVYIGSGESAAALLGSLFNALGANCNWEKLNELTY